MIHYTDGYAAAAVLAGLPMTHARILWDNLPGTITASTAADGRAAERAGQVDTVSWWAPTAAPAWWRISYASAQTVDCVSLAAHTLAGATVTVEGLVGASWVELIEVEPADNSDLMLCFSATVVSAIRISIDAVRMIGVVYAGKALAMLRPGYTSLGLIDLGRQAELTSYVSEGGRLMRRTIQRTGLKASCEWSHLPESWYRATFDPFALRARTEPFFLAARPQGYASDCAYVWVDAPIVPTRMGVKNFLSVSFDVSAGSHL